MAQFACVVPPHIAITLQGKSPVEDYFGKYHLLLAHDVLDKPNLYREMCITIRGRYTDAYIILDNSIVELGTAVDIKDLLEASRIVSANTIVIPDSMGDATETIILATRFVREFRRIRNDWHLHYAGHIIPTLLAVIQGSTMKEALETFEVVTSLPMVSEISVPRIITEQHGSRMPLLQEIFKRHWSNRIHLLGFSDDLMDDVTCARLPFVRGIDSAVPIRAGLKDLTMSLDSPVDPGPRGDFWTTAIETDEQLDCIRNNIELVRSWVETCYD